MVTHRRPSVLRSSALMFALLTALGLVLGAVLSDARAQTAPQYTFTKVADSTEDGFDPNNFGCAAINARGDIAFRAGRLAPDGFNTIDGIYRANSDGTLTTIAEDQRRFVFIGVNPSINDSGQVSFAARLDGGKNRHQPSCGATAGSLLPSRRRRTGSTSSGSTPLSTTAARSPLRPNSTRNSASMRACSRDRRQERRHDALSHLDQRVRRQRFEALDQRFRQHSLRRVGRLRQGHLRGQGGGVYDGRRARPFRSFRRFRSADPEQRRNRGLREDLFRRDRATVRGGDRKDRRRRYEHGRRRHQGEFASFGFRPPSQQQRRRGLPSRPRLRWLGDLRRARPHQRSGDLHGETRWTALRSETSPSARKA